MHFFLIAYFLDEISKFNAEISHRISVKTLAGLMKNEKFRSIFFLIKQNLPNSIILPPIARERLIGTRKQEHYLDATVKLSQPINYMVDSFRNVWSAVHVMGLFNRDLSWKCLRIESGVHCNSVEMFGQPWNRPIQQSLNVINQFLSLQELVSIILSQNREIYTEGPLSLQRVSLYLCKVYAVIWPE